MNEVDQGASGPFARLSAQLSANPYPFYEMLRAQGPVTWVPGLFGLGGWVATNHAICSSVLRSKHFGKEGHRVLPPETLAKIPQEAADSAERRRSNMLFRDPPDHTRLRGLVSQAFTPRMVERLRDHVAGIAEQLLDQIAPHGGVDLLHDFAFPLPVIVIAELLGVPPEDRDRFKAWSTVATVGLSPGVTADQMQKVSVAIEELDAYLGGVIEERRREPREDLISGLIRVQEAGDQLSAPELVATCRLLLTAGHETTVNLIGNGMLALLQHPGELAALAADPALCPGAVEEMLRFDSPVQLTMRFAFEDTTLGEHAIKRGDLVALALGGANRDPGVFPEPTRLQIRRENARENLSFGAGIHFCLGAPLARLEGQIAIGALLRRLPRIALGSAPLRWRNNLVLRGLQELPVTF